jgi:hypothetical protein
VRTAAPCCGTQTNRGKEENKMPEKDEAAGTLYKVFSIQDAIKKNKEK